MKQNYVIPYEDIVLSSINNNHLERLRQWRNKDSIRKWFVDQEIISTQGQLQWFEKYETNVADMMFITQWNGLLVGCAALYAIDLEAKTAEFGRIMVGEEEARGKGIGEKVTYALCNFGFQVLGLEEIYLSVFQDNKIAIRIYEKVGFSLKESTSSELIEMTLTKAALNKVLFG